MSELRDERTKWRHRITRNRRNPAVSAEAKNAINAINFPYITICSEWWTESGMRKEWFSDMSAIYYEDWFELEEPDTQRDLPVRFVNSTLFGRGGGICVTVDSGTETLASVDDLILIEFGCFHTAPCPLETF